MIPVLIWVWLAKLNLDVRNRIKGILLFVLGFFIIVFPVTFHNLFIGKKPVMISHNSGINFYIGNNPSYNGMDQPPLWISWSKIQAQASHALGTGIMNADNALYYEPGYQAANLIKAQIYISNIEIQKALDELYYILDNPQYWYDYTPFYAERMLTDINDVLSEGID